jgi:simple sugar transport system substrate-binding protein
VLDGTWKPDHVWGGIKDGMIRMAPFNAAVPQDVRDLMLKAQADIVSGKLHPFTGPMKDNEGKIRLAAGTTITDDEMNRMDYYVEGVQGRLPSGK